MRRRLIQTLREPLRVSLSRVDGLEIEIETVEGDEVEDLVEPKGVQIVVVQGYLLVGVLAQNYLDKRLVVL